MSIPCLSILMSTPDSRLWRAGQWLRSSEVRRQAESCFSNFQASGKLSKRAEIQKQLWPQSQNNKKNVPHESIGWSGCLCLLLPKQSRINKDFESSQKLLSWKTFKITVMSVPVHITAKNHLKTLKLEWCRLQGVWKLAVNGFVSG